jgi:hypothetical protein
MPFLAGRLPDPLRLVSTIREHIVCGSSALRRTEHSRHGYMVNTANSAPKRLRQTFQVLWSDLDQAMPRSIDIGYQKEGSRNDKW